MTSYYKRFVGEFSKFVLAFTHLKTKLLLVLSNASVIFVIIVILQNIDWENVIMQDKWWFLIALRKFKIHEQNYPNHDFKFRALMFTL